MEKNKTIEQLEAVIRQKDLEILALKVGNNNKAKFNDELDIYRFHNQDLVNAIESEADLSYDFLDRKNPELLARIKIEAPSLWQKLVDEYVRENS